MSDVNLQSGPLLDRRGTDGRFVRGLSGNPGGRSRKTSDGRTLAQVARDHTQAAVDYLREVVANADEPTVLRVQAAATLVRMGWADAPKLPEVPRDLHVVVRQLVVPAQPVPGVINSPVTEHIAQVQRVQVCTDDSVATVDMIEA